ncbi:hypothetical protein F4777DRAFT_66379 [Nemania sp. FL0916]|nr:hypothetical protein F4777DRAFT_66379 [Nemania sp. FL0916]
MEALAALGLASNIVQFLDFTWRLTETAAKVHESSSGAAKNILELDIVYRKLNSFCSSLLAPPQPGGQDCDETKRMQALFPDDVQRQITVNSHISDLRKLASNCTSLCQQLLDATSKLRAREGKSNCKFESFKVALRTLYSEKKIAQLEDMVKRYQTEIALHFLPLIKEHVSYTNSLLQQLREESALLRIEHATQFDHILDRLNELNRNLSAIVPQRIAGYSAVELENTAGSFTTRQLTEKNVEDIVNDISNLSFSEHNITTIEREQAFFRGLNFASRRDRFEDIPLAHKQTFDWIFNPLKQSSHKKAQEHTSLLEWLRSGEGIMWVCGKAGSGKSTLMKYIVNHDETRNALEAWAGQKKKLIIGTHFFWHSGTVMQKSQKGLYQSLLYDFLCACAEQIPRVCPVRWAATKTSGAVSAPLSEQWSTEELLAAINQLTRIPESRITYCVFIDGIDEYDGDHLELCQILKNFACSPSIKCCLSSRPWNVFEDAFGTSSGPRLNLHLLTYKDIFMYTRSRLTEHPRWRTAYFSLEEMESMVKTITRKAQGVFLWVFLVTRSLLSGLTDGDTIYDLQRRFDSLPSDLETFFKHIIDKVDKFHHTKMAQLLLTAINARTPQPLSFYLTQELEDRDSDYALYMTIEDLDVNQLSPLSESCRRRVNARCGGLLEVRRKRVVFLHRTVRDFLLTHEINDYLHRESGPKFNVNLSTLKVYVYMFRCWLADNSHIPLSNLLSKDQSILRDGLAYANDALVEDLQTALSLLDAVEDSYENAREPIDPLLLSERFEDFYENANGPMDSSLLGVTHGSSFQSEILKAGVDRYVTVKLQSNVYFYNLIQESPLYTIIKNPPWKQEHMNIVTELLKSGSDPNASGCETPWQLCLQRTLGGSSFHDNLTKALKSYVFSQFLESGARRDEPICIYGNYIGPSLRESRLPSTQFLIRLFLFETSHRLSRECLHALSDFYEHDGDFGQTKSQLIETLPVLQGGLHGLSVGKTEPGRMPFFAQVLRMLARKWQPVASELRAELRKLEPSLRETFPAGTADMLVKMICRPDDVGSSSKLSQQLPSSSKRSLESGDNQEDDSPSKKLPTLGYH